MPDDTNSLNSTNDPSQLIRTQAELEETQAQAAELESDLALTNETDAAYHECEALLRIVQGDIATFKTNAAANPPPANIAAPAVADAPLADQPTPITTPLLPTVPGPSQTTRINAPPAVVIGADNIDRPPGETFPEIPAVRPLQFPQPGPGVQPDFGPPADDHDQINLSSLGAQPDFNAQQMERSADQVQRALELTTQSQISLYERMLDLLNNQNLKLAEFDRKTVELTSQIKSLKNP